MTDPSEPAPSTGARDAPEWSHHHHDVSGGWLRPTVFGAMDGSERARADGLKRTGEGGLLARLTKLVVESSLEGELDDHLGYGRHDAAGRDGGNSRNGKRAKTLLTEAGPGVDRGADGPGWLVRAEDGGQAAATAVGAG